MDVIKEMFALQAKLNTRTNGKIWRKGKTKEGRKINWYRCIYMEATEAIDSFNWKHWKNLNEQHNWQNLQVEMVDLWHFIMSAALFEGFTLGSNFDYPKPNKINTKASEHLIEHFEKIIHFALSAHLKKISEIENIINEFFRISNHLEMDKIKLYEIYVIKNQLNIFRQNHGYKNGSYQKIWQGVEDNVIAFRLMQNKTLSPEGLYQALEHNYQSSVTNLMLNKEK